MARVSSYTPETMRERLSSCTPIYERSLRAPVERDNHEHISDPRQMNDITRYELDAKLETIEARMDGRVASIEAKIDSFLSAQAERDKRVDLDIARMAESQAGIRADIKSMKTTTIVTAITAVLAIVFGIATFNATLTSNMISAFQMGKGERVEAPVQQSVPSVSPPPPVPATTTQEQAKPRN